MSGVWPMIVLKSKAIFVPDSLFTERLLAFISSIFPFSAMLV